MKSDNFKLAFIGLFILLALVIGGFQLKAAIECNEKGGVYLTGKGVWPVCLKAETL